MTDLGIFGLNRRSRQLGEQIGTNQAFESQSVLLVWQQLMVMPSSDSTLFCYWSEQISVTRLLIKGLYVLRSLLCLLS